jgi:hypothetical protein
VNEKMTMEYYNFIKPQLPSKKKRRGLSAKVVVPELEEVITKESIFSIPQRKKTFAQFGIVQVEMLHRLIEVVGHHHRNCPHKITHFSHNTLTAGFCVVIHLECEAYSGRSFKEKGVKCAVWPNSRYTWKSGEDVTMEGNKYNVFDILFAIAQCMTPVSKAHSEQLMRAMLLTPVNRGKMDVIIARIVKPYLIQQKKNVIAGQFEKVKLLGAPLRVSMDVGYDSVRSANNAVIFACVGQIPLFHFQW